MYIYIYTICIYFCSTWDLCQGSWGNLAGLELKQDQTTSSKRNLCTTVAVVWFSVGAFLDLQYLATLEKQHPVFKKLQGPQLNPQHAPLLLEHLRFVLWDVDVFPGSMKLHVYIYILYISLSLSPKWALSTWLKIEESWILDFPLSARCTVGPAVEANSRGVHAVFHA